MSRITIFTSCFNFWRDVTFRAAIPWVMLAMTFGRATGHRVFAVYALQKATAQRPIFFRVPAVLRIFASNYSLDFVMRSRLDERLMYAIKVCAVRKARINETS